LSRLPLLIRRSFPAARQVQATFIIPPQQPASGGAAGTGSGWSLQDFPSSKQIENAHSRTGTSFHG
jgi:hypothetical protein